MTTTTACRSCGSSDRRVVLSFGDTPLSDVLLTAEQLQVPEARYPLELMVCEDCALVQLRDSVDPVVLYGGHYPYYSSVSPGLVAHFEACAEQLRIARGLGPDSLVVEAASNDGVLLRPFADAGIPVLGIDPAHGPAAAAEAAGVPTMVDYFGLPVAERLAAAGRRADLLLGANVLNLVDDPNDFAAATARLLTDDGVAVLEVPYVADTVDQGAFDNVFHQNVTYWSATSAADLFARHGLALVDAERIETFGGSLRLSIARHGVVSPRLDALLGDERARGVDTFDYFAGFAARTAATREALVDLLRSARANGARIAAYGAAGGMATTLLSYAGIDSALIDYAVDRNPHKHGWFTAGSHLEIHPPDRLVDDPPDLLLLCAWNYEREVLAQQHAFRAAGGRVVVPIPHPRIV
ncbi:methyltransferase domain-containing protein [Egibacter rhizosphaerae]|uniref:Methyltransferase domain-containing protein n=1 Tax=Egibacter rhizosphaerae TaxID=1670831 RepID=A0A411YLD1_9ACTN|nr:methyltransferase domain-containing protein [Egibacter rhizosphaerae]